MDFKLPAMPTALAEVVKIQRNPVPDNEALVEIIEHDPALALYVLRLINSAYYGLRKQVSQINRAVTLLGSKKVCNLVLTAILKQTFPNIKGRTARAVYQHILKNSIATAVFSRDLADHLLLSSAETAFTGPDETDFPPAAANRVSASCVGCLRFLADVGECNRRTGDAQILSSRQQLPGLSCRRCEVGRPAAKDGFQSFLPALRPCGSVGQDVASEVDET